MRNYIRPNERSQKLRSYAFRKGTTAVLDEKIIRKEDLGNFVSVAELSTEEGADTMEVDT